MGSAASQACGEWAGPALSRGRGAVKRPPCLGGEAQPAARLTAHGLSSQIRKVCALPHALVRLGHPLALQVSKAAGRASPWAPVRGDRESAEVHMLGAGRPPWGVGALLPQGLLLCWPATGATRSECGRPRPLVQSVSTSGVQGVLPPHPRVPGPPQWCLVHAELLGLARGT